MDSYTDPQSNTYMLWTRFSMPGGKRAFATPSSVAPTIIAAYTILIQFLFVGLWQVVSCIILSLAPMRKRPIRYLGLVAFWNANDPWAASMIMLSYLARLTVRRTTPSSDVVPRKSYWWDLGYGICLFGTSATIAIGALATSIFLPYSLTIGSVAPVHPDAVFLPLIEDVTFSTVSKISSLYAAPALRAIGSVEAVTQLTLRSRVSVKRTLLSGSDETRPVSRIDYGYNVTGQDFGLQGHFQPTYTIRGSCYTEYNWLRSRNNSTLDEYWPWGYQNLGIPVVGNSSPNASGILAFSAFLHPSLLDDPTVSNKSFSLIASTSHVASYTASTDPWYLTETPEAGQSFKRGAGYRVKAGRPVLSCWEEGLFCYDGLCKNPSTEISSLTLGVQRILSSRIGAPILVSLGLSAGVGSLKSYTGSAGGGYIDAESSTLEADITRLILAAFLSTRDIFRETTMFDDRKGTQNALLDPRGRMLPGAGNFVLSSAATTTFSFQVAIAVPISFVAVWSIAMLLAIPRLSRLEGEGRFVKGRWDLYIAKAAALKAPQLYRMIDENLNRNLDSSPNNHWTKRGSHLPGAPSSTRVAPRLYFNQGFELREPDIQLESVE